MTRVKGRGPAADHRARPHLPVEHPDNPGCCTCGLPMAVKNLLHQLPAVDPDITAAERRRVGET